MSTFPLVGTYFRPFGKTLLAALPGETVLRAVPEPENPYDEHAIAVYVNPKHAQGWEALKDAAKASGLEDDAWEQLFHIGYIAKTETHYLHYHEAEAPWLGKLGFSPDGKPTFIFVG